MDIGDVLLSNGCDHQAPRRGEMDSPGIPTTSTHPCQNRARSAIANAEPLHDAFQNGFDDRRTHVEEAEAHQCFLCDHTTSWNDINGVGFFKHH